jgi:doublecortin-like kinase 1/2
MEVSVQSSNSNHSAKSELEKDISDLDVSEKNGKNGLNGSENINNLSSEKLNTLKKRISSSKTPNRTRETTKAKRVRFFRNGDKFWTGYLVAVSNERYK